MNGGIYNDTIQFYFKQWGIIIHNLNSFQLYFLLYFLYNVAVVIPIQPINFIPIFGSQI